MLCDDCKKNEACVHITQISTAGKMDKNLCEACAQQYGNIVFDANAGFSVNDFLKGIFSSGQQWTETPVTQDPLVCPNCGMKYTDFMHTGKIGCSICYETFGEKLDPLLRRIHGSSAHSGKIPHRCCGEIERRQQIAALRKMLAMHVEKEEYEAAAQLRDQIKTLEKQTTQTQDETEGAK